jgi:hypothetical protein
VTPPTPALDEAVHRYRDAIDTHRDAAEAEKRSGHTIAARRHREAVRWLERGLAWERVNPPIEVEP